MEFQQGDQGTVGFDRIHPPHPACQRQREAPQAGTYLEHDLSLKAAVTLRSESGLPGDTIVYDQHRLTINGELVPLESSGNPGEPGYTELLDEREHRILIQNPRYTIADGKLSFGPLMATRMACPPPRDEVEARFLEALESTTRYNFLLGRLALTWQTENTTGSLIFSAQPLPMALPAP